MILKRSSLMEPETLTIVTSDGIEVFVNHDSPTIVVRRVSVNELVDLEISYVHLDLHNG